MTAEQPDSGYRGSKYLAADGSMAVLWLPTNVEPPPVIDGQRPQAGEIRFTYAGPISDDP